MKTLALLLLLTNAISGPGAPAPEPSARSAGSLPAGPPAASRPFLSNVQAPGPGVTAAGRAAPDFVLRSLDGRTIRAHDLRGKVVLLNFWATWCGPCRFEMPRLAALSRKHRTEGLEVVGVSMDDGSPDLVAKFARAHDAGYTIAMANEPITKAYGGLRSIPETFVIDRDGTVVRNLIGVPPPGFEEEIRRLLEK